MGCCAPSPSNALPKNELQNILNKQYLDACLAGDHILVKQLLAQNADILCHHESHGDTGLHLACSLACETRHDSFSTSQRVRINSSFLKHHQDSTLFSVPIHDEVDSRKLTCPPIPSTLFHRLLTIKVLLDHGFDVNEVNREGDTPLMVACCHVFRSSHLLIKHLLAHGADVHHRNAENTTPLFVAVSSGSEEIVRLLWQAAGWKEKQQEGKGHLSEEDEGFDEDRKIRQHAEDLFTSMFSAETTKTSTISSSSSSVSVRSSSSSQPMSNDSTLRRWVNKKTEPEHINNIGETLLSLAVYHQRPAVVDFLLHQLSPKFIEKHASCPLTPENLDLFTEAKKKKQPIRSNNLFHVLIIGYFDRYVEQKEEFATEVETTCLQTRLENFISIVDFLIQFKHDLNQHSSSQGDTPLLLTLHHERMFDLAASFVHLGADPNLWNDEKQSPLVLLCSRPTHELNEKQREEQKIVLRALLQNGADVNHIDRQGQTVLMHAVWNLSYPMVNIILSFKIDHQSKTVDTCALDQFGNSALFFACARPSHHRISTQDHLRMVSALIRKGSNPTHVNHQGENVLHWALRVEKPSVSLLRFLFRDHHVSISQKSNHNVSPSDILLQKNMLPLIHKMEAVL